MCAAAAGGGAFPFFRLSIKDGLDTRNYSNWIWFFCSSFRRSTSFYYILFVVSFLMSIECCVQSKLFIFISLFLCGNLHLNAMQSVDIELMCVCV